MPEAESKSWPSSPGDDTPGQRGGPAPGETKKPTGAERWALYSRGV